MTAGRLVGGEEEREAQSLGDSTRSILEEARMILPGTQTLFGFQLIVPFNQRFQDQLSVLEQRLHLLAMALVALAMAMLMTPAIYHRQVEPESVSRRFIHLASRLLTWSSRPLLVAICLDFYLAASLITRNAAVSAAVSLTLAGLFAGFWLVLPARAARPR